MKGFYLICFLLSFSLFLWQSVSDARQSVVQRTALLIVIISNGGYLALAGSSNLTEAVLATKILYVAACFLPMLYFITGGHIKRTSTVVRIFADELLKADLGFDPVFLHLVVRSAPMHDLGKIGVDDAILRKQGKFTPEEYAKMKEHPAIGARIVKEVLTDVEAPDFVAVAVNVAHYHHEKVDGTGYPCGLKSTEIPVEARIMALADVFDALVSKRCYKEAFSFDKAFSIIAQDAGTHFDPELASVFLRCRPQLEHFYQEQEKDHEQV